MTPTTSSPQPSARTLLAGLALGGLLLSGCGDGTTTAQDPAPEPASGSASASASASASGSASGSASPSRRADSAWPSFAPTDYDYVLGVQCYCAITGDVAISVRDGVVTEAVVSTGAEAGSPAPEFARLTIEDILARADEATLTPPPGQERAKVTVDWPDGAAAPTSVSIDQLPGAVDDEVSYRISEVRTR